MDRRIAGAALSVSALVLVGIVWMGSTHDPVYSVAQVEKELTVHPRAWVGRTVLVRGTLVMAEGQGGWGNTWNNVWWANWSTVGGHPFVPSGVSFHIILVARRDQFNPNTAAAGPSMLPQPSLVVLVPKGLIPSADIRPSALGRVMAQVPFLGRLLSPPPTLRSGVPSTYRVRLMYPARHCVLVCDDAVLQGATVAQRRSTTLEVGKSAP